MSEEGGNCSEYLEISVIWENLKLGRQQPPLYIQQHVLIVDNGYTTAVQRKMGTAMD